MKPEMIKELEILSELSKEEHTTQRALSMRLGIALGLINAFIKRLSRKGYIKITTLPRNRIKYLLTPTGFLEKSRLTLEYIQYSYTFYREARKNISAYLEELKKNGKTSVALVGTGELAEITYFSMQEAGIPLLAVIDDKKIGGNFFGIKIIGTKDFSADNFDTLIITDTNPIAALENAAREKMVFINDICK
jgi:DNA-binding MarR family transcriptional regulator